MTGSSAPMRSSYIADMGERARRVLDPLVNSTKPFALLDFPDHPNVGDSAIYCGEMAYLRARGMMPGYVSTIDNFDPAALEEAIGDGPILLHGGGNFGDLWPWYQVFREEILARYPGRTVIQMPQTIHYGSQERIAQTAREIERHGAFVLLVRDQASHDFARAHFACEVHLCPDMAFQLGAVPRDRPSKDLLLHFRTDKEAAGNWLAGEAMRQHADVRDWPEERSALRKRLLDLTALPGMAPAYLTKGRRAAWAHLYERRARIRIGRGFRLLSSYRHIVTDRLHGHIMSSLLQIPHCVIDNSYGKLSQYIETWGSDPCCLGLFPDADSALARLDETKSVESPVPADDADGSRPAAGASAG